MGGQTLVRKTDAVADRGRRLLVAVAFGWAHRAQVAAATLLLLLSVSLDADARSKSARAEFQRQNPCPATGKARGPCPGYQVDHITPLKCKGGDTPTNMQWLSVEQHKIKTAREAKECRR